jgi:hypothetical protein
LYGILESEVDDILLFFGEGLNLIGIVVLVLQHVLVFLYVVVHVPESHLCLRALQLDLFRVCQCLVLMELLLDRGEQFEPVFGRIVLHVF